MELIFLDPLEQNREQEHYILQEVTSMIRDTPDLLRIAVAYFTHQEIANALIERTQAGKPSNLIVNTSDILRPVNAGESEIAISKYLLDVLKCSDNVRGPLFVKSLGTRTKFSYQNMHHKFVVSYYKAIFGSLNWTRAAFQNNFECVSISTEKNIVRQFCAEFDRIWAKAPELLSDQNRIRVIACPMCGEQWSVDFESYGPFCTYCGHRFRVIS